MLDSQSIINFFKYWKTSFSNPYDWFTAKAKSRDNHLRKKYNYIHKELSVCPLRDIYTMIEKHDYDKRLYIGILILLDQVSRQLYRNDCLAFSNDAKARRIARHMCKKYNMTDLKEITTFEFCFWMIVFEHSENLSDHIFIRDILDTRIKNTSCKKDKAILDEMMQYLDAHTIVLKRFGYYPKRKLVCGKRLNENDKHYIENENKGLPF